MTPVNEQLERLRAICIALPEVEERLSHGEPTWFIRGKRSFAMFADHHHDDRLAFWCAAGPGVQSSFINAEPIRYFSPPYFGCRGWLGVYLDVEVNWNEVADIVIEAYRSVAPKNLLHQLDSR